MTARDALDGMKASSEGLTDLCAEHMRQGIRHLQRNCDIECNAHAAAEDWDACKQPDRYDGARMALALASIPRLIDAVDAVLAQADTLDALGNKAIANRIRAAIENALTP